MKIRVFVVEDHPLMRRSLIEAIEREVDLTVCGQAEDAQAAYAAVVSVQPDIGKRSPSPMVYGSARVVVVGGE